MAMIDYVLEDAEEADAAYLAIFEALREYLQPDTVTTQQQVLARIREASPKWPEPTQGRLSGATETDDFHLNAFELAQQTPYDHPNMHKLVSLVVTVIDDIDAAACEQPWTDIHYPAQWYHAMLGDYASRSEPLQYVREKAFDAEITANIKTRQSPSELYEVLSLERAFEFATDDKNVDAEIMAAALCIRYNGARIYEAAFVPTFDDTSELNTGVRSVKRVLSNVLSKVSSSVGCSKGDREPGRYATPLQWAKWKKGFVKASGSKSRFNAEVRGLAAQAASIMEELEWIAQSRPSMASSRRKRFRLC